MENPEKDTALVEVIIIVDGHEHEGKPVKKGDKIKVTTAERDWMASLKTPVIKG
ncbi:MAG: DUF7210 family protein [Methylobacter sp.]